MLKKFLKILSLHVQKNKDYVFLIRDKVDTKGCVEVENIAEAIDYFNRKKGSILITTGSKELHFVKALGSYEERCYVRVLPVLFSLQKATELGFRGSHIIAMEGPFSLELNKVLLKETGVQYLLTKESGSTGGLEEKIKAAKDSGVTVVLIKRPSVSSGYSYEGFFFNVIK